MSRIIFITILIFAFSPAAFAQQEELPEIRCGIAFDNFGKLPKEDLYGRLDNFIVALRNNPDAEGFFFLELDKNQTKAKKLQTLNRIFKHLNYRKFDLTRISFLVSEHKEDWTILQIVPAGAQITQIISESDAENIIKGEEFEQKIKTLFPKK
jgi:hypothetical protein